MRRRLADRQPVSVRENGEGPAVAPKVKSDAIVTSRTMQNRREMEDLQKKRIKEQKKLARHRIYQGFMGVLILLGLVVLLVVSQTFFTISGVRFEKNPDKTPEISKIEGVVGDYLLKNPLQRSLISLNKTELNNYVKNKMPEVETINLSKNGLIDTAITVKMREPVAVWNMSGVPMYTDASGAIFEHNYFSDPGVTVQDDSGVPADAAGVSGKFLKFIGQISADLEQKGLTVEKVTIPFGAVRYVEFKLANRPYPIKAQTDRDTDSQTNDIVNMMKYLDEHKITPQYVDLRVESKGYWK